MFQAYQSDEQSMSSHFLKESAVQFLYIRSRFEEAADMYQSGQPYLSGCTEPFKGLKPEIRPDYCDDHT